MDLGRCGSAENYFIVDVKRNIIKAAGEMFYKYGVRSVSIDDICNEIHISKKTFYVHFRQKDDLVAEFLSCIRQQQVRDHEAVVRSENVVEFMLSNFKKFSVQSVMDKHAALFFDLEKYYPELYAEHQRENKAGSVSFTLEILECGVRQGLFRGDLDCEMMARFVTNAFTYVFEVEKSIPNSAKAMFMMDVFMRTVCSERGLEYYLKNRM